MQHAVNIRKKEQNTDLPPFLLSLKKMGLQNAEVLTDVFRQIESLVKHLDLIHECMMQKYEQDFVTAYKEHALKVQTELLIYKKRCSDYYLKMKKNDRIRFLESSIKWFRDEAMDLAMNMQKLKKNNELLKT